MNTIIYRDPQTLKLHSELKRIHTPPPDTAVWHSFKLGLDNAGIEGIPPICITPRGEIMDGARRWLAAKDLQWERIACIERPDSDATVIIVDSLLGQKDMTRGAKVYQIIDLIPEFTAQSHKRSLANLDPEAKIYRKPLISSMLSNSTPRSVEELCQRLGVGRNCYYKAREVHDVFHDPKCQQLAAKYEACQLKTPRRETLAEYQAKIREEYEPKLLSGEYNLWNILPAVMGRLATEEKARNTLGQLTLWKDGFETFCRRAAQMTVTEAEARAQASKTLAAIEDEEELQNVCNTAGALYSEAKARLKNLHLQQAA